MMRYIGENDDLLNLLIGKHSIISASVTKIAVYEEEYLLCVDIFFTLLYAKVEDEKELKLHLVDVVEYNFYYNNTRNFYDVERFKFFKSDSGYYISPDPVDESRQIAEEDNDFVLAKKIEGYFI